ncbi:MAG: hypothetical protein AVDCRST_MAG76-2412 [uncultured Acidimicrobiales bacterium]|uniref:Uncharacterized protein n=1 Tax=uncultured Acidimicrobiales bacterium TaxID=310071 RepID=A0A6J4IL37_9ACTN|nr:MAG: hypothetical protein AVDCRST_MAG76-2412 [uncultured Acidimicrobiales bacterium]
MSWDGVLVGGEPEAILGASVSLHEVAFRTDNVGVNLARALAPAATTLLATTPFAPVQAAAVDRALAAVLAGPGAGLGQVASAYEAASFQLRSAGQALEVAGLAALVGSAGIARLQGQRATVLTSAEGVDVAREAMSAGSSAGPVGVTDTLGVRQVQRPDGTTFYVVELITSPRAAASFGAHVNGWGGFAESATGMETTLRWAVATKEDAEVLAGQASLGLVPVVGDDLAGGLPPPTEIAIGDVSSATAVGAPLIVLAGASANLTMRREMTVRTGGGQRLAMTISGAGQIGLIGVAGTGGGASVRIGMERDERGTVTKLSVATVTEVDRGRHGLAPLEAANREATREEREWELELTPELRARADRLASALAERREPDWHDVRALTEAVLGLDPTVRTYDVRHQQLSGDVAIPGAKVGGALGMATARLRTP